MLVTDDDKLNNLLTIAYPRCEVAETLQGEYCERSGTVGFAGLRLCERHARLLEAQDRMTLLEGIVSSLGLCLRSIPLRKNKDVSMLVRAAGTGEQRTCPRSRSSETGHSRRGVLGGLHGLAYASCIFWAVRAISPKTVPASTVARVNSRPPSVVL